MTKLILSFQNSRIATVKKWVYEERRGGNRTGRLFQKLLIKLVQNLTQSFINIGRDHVLLTTVLHYSFKSTPTTVLVLKH